VKMAPCLLSVPTPQRKVGGHPADTLDGCARDGQVREALVPFARAGQCFFPVERRQGGGLVSEVRCWKAEVRPPLT
jgi:hypothetical protein